MKTISTMPQAKNAKAGVYRLEGATGVTFRKVSDAPGAGAFNQRYWRGGERRTMSLGPLSRFKSLAEVQARSREVLTERDKGVDPIAKRDAEKAANLAAKTPVNFAQATEAYLKVHGPRWRHRYAIASWRNPVVKYAYPVIGHLGLDDILSRHVATIMEAAVADGNEETAKRVRSRIDAIRNFAVRKGQCDSTRRSPADAKLHPLKRVGANFRRIELDDAQATFHALCEARAASAASVRTAELDAWVFAIACAARPSEALYARWSEVDLDKKEWKISAARTKKERDHRVPLNSVALEVLERRRLVSAGDLVFTGPSGALSYTGFALAPKRAGIDAATLHSWRSIFRDWAGVVAHIDGDLAELALAHVLDKTKRAYFRDTAVEPRRLVMAKYADWLNRVDAKVVAFPARA